jgi:diacylglycerol kinase family enzyme
MTGYAAGSIAHAGRARIRLERKLRQVLAAMFMRRSWDHILGNMDDREKRAEPQRPVLLVNPRSGGGKAARAGLAERARERDIDVIVVRPDDHLAALVDEAVARGADVLGVAGGDGSLAVVAAAAVAHELPFVCIPAGTRNHFALDVGVDRHDLVGALDAFTDAVERRIDVAEVNDRLFLNNVSLGIYGDAVRQPNYRDAKARTLLETAAHVLGPSTVAVDLRLVDDRGRPHHNPAVVLVSNNPYSLEPPRALGTRPRLDGGHLGVLVLEAARAGQGPGRTWTAARLEVTAPAPVHAGIDGEAVDLTPPLRFAIRSGALRIRIPSRDATA